MVSLDAEADQTLGPGPVAMSPAPDGLARARVTVDTPATSANLGAGFDTLALALEVSNRITVEVSDGPPGSLELEVEGEGEGVLDSTGTDRFTTGLRLGLAELGVDPAGYAFRVSMRNRIPFSRGLGSSASATVAGLVSAAALTGRTLDPQRALVLACQAEGHPDNAAAALRGGFVVVSHADGDARAVRLDPPDDLVAALYIPDRPLSTTAMRAALPKTVAFRDAVHNVGAASTLVAAMATGRLDLLRGATEDRLHEPYRARAVYRELRASSLRRDRQAPWAPPCRVPAPRSSRSRTIQRCRGGGRGDGPLGDRPRPAGSCGPRTSPVRGRVRRRVVSP